MIAVEALQILEMAKFDSAQARAIVQAIDREIEERKNTLATKEDIHLLELKLERVQSELIKWIFIFIMGQTALLLGVSYFFFSHLK